MIKEFTKIAAKAMLKWAIVVAIGFIVSLIFLVVVCIQNSELGDGILGLLKGLLLENTAGFALVLGAPFFIVLYFVLANKVAIQTAIHLLWKNKAENFIGERVKAIVDGITSKSDWANKISNSAFLRVRLLEAASNDPESSGMKRKVMKFIFKRIRLDDINFRDENLRLSDIISNKINSFISEMSEPSLLLFWLLMGLQVSLFVVSQFYVP